MASVKCRIRKAYILQQDRIISISALNAHCDPLQIVSCGGIFKRIVWSLLELLLAGLPQVQFVLPKDAADHLWRQIDGGSAGINQVIESLCHVDSEQAKAWKLEDEIKVTLGDETMTFLYFSILFLA